MKLPKIRAWQKLVGLFIIGIIALPIFFLSTREKYSPRDLTKIEKEAIIEQILDQLSLEFSQPITDPETQAQVTQVKEIGKNNSEKIGRSFMGAALEIDAGSKIYEGTARKERVIEILDNACKEFIGWSLQTDPKPPSILDHEGLKNKKSDWRVRLHQTYNYKINMVLAKEHDEYLRQEDEFRRNQLFSFFKMLAVLLLITWGVVAWSKALYRSHGVELPVNEGLIAFLATLVPVMSLHKTWSDDQRTRSQVRRRFTMLFLLPFLVMACLIVNKCKSNVTESEHVLRKAINNSDSRISTVEQYAVNGGPISGH